MVENIFTIKAEDLNRLGPEEAVFAFGELLWSEARRLSIPLNKISISRRVSVPDGGVDASVRDVQTDEGIIKSGYTTYQIKSGENFDPWTTSDINKEFFGTAQPSNENLAPSIKSCLEKNGTYILACFKKDINAEQLNKANACISAALLKADFSSPKFEVWGQNNLIAFIQRFPALALQLNHRGNSRFQDHGSWAKETEMTREFQIDAEIEKIKNGISDELRKPNGACHIRILGEPGIGKTRLALEATRPEDLAALVVYSNANVFLDSDLMQELLRNNFEATLVLDECDSDLASTILNKFQGNAPKVKLVTIFNEFERKSGNTTAYYEMPLLPKEATSKIIQSYDIPVEQANAMAELCGGSPRVAQVIGMNLTIDPKNLLATPETMSDIWKRFISGSQSTESPESKARELILQHIALFKKFGFGRQVANEADVIAKLVHDVDPNITTAKFSQIVLDLKERKILQGENYLYITPKALHIKLWLDWWKSYQRTFDIKKWGAEFPADLFEWFGDMFQYAAESEVTAEKVKELLSVDGLFGDGKFIKDKLGSSFFLELTKADQKAALKILKHTVATWTKEELLHFVTGRSEVLWSLTIIARDPDLFMDAARILLKLAEAENQTYSNNATGDFAGLFSPAPNELAPTALPPLDRVPVLREALFSENNDITPIALKACDQALESSHWSGPIQFEYLGLRRTPELWKPKTWGEFFDYYKAIWAMILERIDSLDAPGKEKAADIILRHIRPYVRLEPLEEMVFSGIEALLKKDYVDKNKVLGQIIQVLHYGKKLEPAIKDRLTVLKESLTGKDFHALLNRYVGMQLTEDYFNESGEQVDQSAPKIVQLAKEALADPAKLKSEYEWLFIGNNANSYRFGYEVGNLDSDFVLLNDLVEEQKKYADKKNVMFLSGYLHVLFEKKQELWETTLDNFAQDNALAELLPEITWRAGMTDRAAKRMLDLAKKQKITVQSFRYFTYGGVVKKMSDEVFGEWMDYLLAENDRLAAVLALVLFDSHYLHGNKEPEFPKDLTLKLITNPLLFTEYKTKYYDQMDSFHWAGIARKFVVKYPDDAIEVAKVMLQNLGSTDSIIDRYDREVTGVLTEIAKINPEKVWAEIAKNIEPRSNNKRAFEITHWLRGGFFNEGAGSFGLFPPKVIWDWVDEDKKNRAAYLASFVPKILYNDPDGKCLARELLAKYGSEEFVKRNLMANFSSDGWSGPASQHYQKKKEELLEFKKMETNQLVKDWVDEYVEILDKDIESAKIDEERRGY